MNKSDLIAVARGDKEADLLLANALIVNTFNGTIEEGNIAILGDRIAGVGNYQKALKTIDLKGAYLAPGLIDGHTHVESSMLHPVNYASAVVPRGTTSVFTDLHEITNVCGLKGIEFYSRWAQKLPLDMFIMAPSCVPATDMETAGAKITAKDILKILHLPGVAGLGEMMNFPGVIFADPFVMVKIEGAGGKVIDGHAPMVTGNQLNAYISAGISSDHESTSLDEASEKLRKGLYIMIREGSTEKNLQALLPLVTDKTYKRCMFVVDDRSCSDLAADGDLDAIIRKAIKLGLDPVRAVQLATINTCEHFRIFNRGAIAPGYIANLITLSDLSKFEIDMVFYEGKLVAEKGIPCFSLPEIRGELNNSVKVKPFGPEALVIRSNNDNFPVIQIVPGQIITKNLDAGIKSVNGQISPVPGNDILKLVVVERHRGTGNIGLGLVKGFGLKKGALASSVAHDSHNIISVGCSDTDIYAAIKEVEKSGGGLAVCENGRLLASLPLPIGGLLSEKPLDEVVKAQTRVSEAAAALGSIPDAPFALLSFLALPVIPELKLTDKGLVDVVQFKLIS
jgi:adenine deaminase